MKRKFISTVIAAFTFIAMMSVTALANPVATVNLVPGAIADGQLEVGVYVEAAAPGVSALVVDVDYTGVARQAAQQRTFTATVDGTSVNVHTASVTQGITFSEDYVFGMTFDQFISPPADGALRLFFEMEGNDVLTESGRAATITFNVPEGVTAGTVTPVIHTVDGHQFAYRWTTTGDGYVHLGDAVVAGPPARFGDGLLNLPGDVNRDYVLNTADLVRMRHYFALFPVEICYINGDVNGDGVVNTADLVRMRHYFALFPVELVPHGSMVN